MSKASKAENTVDTLLEFTQEEVGSESSHREFMDKFGEEDYVAEITRENKFDTEDADVTYVAELQLDYFSDIVTRFRVDDSDGLDYEVEFVGEFN